MNVLGIPHLKDYSLVTGKVFFLFEHFKSYDLGSFISKNGPLDIYNALQIIRNVAETFEKVWEKNEKVHQNILPRNIRINNKLETRIMNIGLSQYLLKDQTLLEQGFNIWDQRYMSPEFATKGKGNTPLCDIYATGAILYYMITGKHPYLNIPVEKIPMAPVPEIKGDIPAQVISLVQLMMAKHNAVRLQNWNEVIERIDAISTKSRKLQRNEKFTQFYAKYSTNTDSMKPVGLSSLRKEASIEKIKLKKAAAKESKMTNTIAKLAKPELKAVNSTWQWQKRQKKANKGGLKNYIGLFIVLFLALFAGLPVLFMVFYGKSKKVVKKDIPVNNTVPAVTKEELGDMPQARADLNENSSLPGKIQSDDPFIIEMTAIDDFYKNNPEKLCETIEKYDDLSDRAFCANRGDIVKSVRMRIFPIGEKEQNQTEEKIRIVMAGLSEKVLPLLNEKKYNEAIEIIQNYNGELSGETVPDRRRLVRKIKGKLKEIERKNNEIEDALKILAEKLAPKLLSKKFMEAEIQLKLAYKSKENKLPDEILNDWSTQIAAYEQLSKKYSDTDNAFEIIRSTENSQKLENAHIVKGMLLFEKNQYWDSVAEFEKIPYKGRASFISRIKKIAKKAEYDLRFRSSVAEFSEILQAYSFSFDEKDQEDLLLQMTKKKISKKNTVKLAEALDEFSKNKENSDFLEKNGHLIDALNIYCRRITGEKISDKTEPDVIRIFPNDNISKIFSNAKPGMSYLFTDGEYQNKNVQFDVSNITISGEPNAVFEGKYFIIHGSKIKISKMKFRNTSVNFGKATDVEVDNCIFEGKEVSVNQSSGVVFLNCLFNGIALLDSFNMKFTHCTFLSGPQELDAAISLSSEDVYIKDSIIYGVKYGIIVLNEKTNKKYTVEKSLLFGEEGFCAKKSGKKAIDKRDIAKKLSQIRRYLTVKSNIYDPPQFINPLKGDYRLVKGVPGCKDASDKKGCGVIW